MVRKTVTASVAAIGLLGALALPPAGASNDADYGKLWNLEKIGAPAAWARTTGAHVRVGIVDAGVDLGHEDLAGRVVANTSCLKSKGDPANCSGPGQDEVGHGTHVAGIIAADKDNGIGVAGVAPDAELVVAKVADSGGGITIDDANAGIKWVVDHGARVVNLSLGDLLFVRTAAFGTKLSEGIEYAWQKGAVPVIASGNSDLFGAGVGSQDYGDLDALVVGATGPDDLVTDYSSPTGNAKWALVAPGGASDGEDTHKVWSTYWEKDKQNQYGWLAGTSMAAPHVTGAVALLLAEGFTPQAAVQRLLDTADTNVKCGPDSPTCKGRLDVARATAR
ncbi:MAG TPA: S8 family serine peptidase [Acidimicrobiia bacterium]|nr:S8 family serine peptidase [Acidimicrobiia bacterium]